MGYGKPEKICKTYTGPNARRFIKKMTRRARRRGREAGSGVRADSASRTDQRME